ncbi:hypothetical protein [Streptomyces sp. NPDC059759]|uniref:hypothetical protein n=1 Tax=Streptomyces sp. NPDC059759 TaxID=3346936 RepID=UPI003660E717
MGFKATVRTVTIKFAEGHQYHGAEARVRSMTLGEYMEAAGYDGGDGDDTPTSLRKFGSNLVSWNLEDDDEKPIPATFDGMQVADQGLVRAMQAAWIQAVVGVHDADPLPESSTSGDSSLVESVPMEALSESLAS